MEVTVTLETGQNVQLPVVEAHKPGSGPVLTLLRPWVVQIVLGKQLKIKLAMKKTVQVIEWLSAYLTSI